MNNKYLDFTGLSTYDQKIKEYIGDHSAVIDETLTQEGEAADAKVTGDQIKSTTKSLAAIPGENIIALTDFTDTSHATYTVNEDNITVTAESGTYPCVQTVNTWIASHLVIGRTYRLYAKAEKVSGNPNIRVCIRGISGNENGIAKAIALNDGGEGFVDFVADAYMKRITLMVGFATSVTGASVSFSDIWLKEYNTVGIDYEAREDIGELDGETTNIRYVDNKQTEYLFDIPTNLTIGDLVVNGAMQPTNGRNTTDSAKRTRTGYITITNPVSFTFTDDDYEYTIYSYTSKSVSNGVKSLTHQQYVSGETIIIDPSEGFTYIRIGFRRKDDANLTTTVSDPTSDYYKITVGSQFHALSSSNNMQTNTLGSGTVLAETNGHIRYYSGTLVTKYKLPIYKAGANSTVVQEGVVDGSDFISVGGSYVNVILYKTTDTNLSSCSCYIYFYDANKNVVWDILDYTDTSTNVKNKVSISYLKTLNGFQFTNIPAGYFIRVAGGTNTECRLAVWDGKPFGYPITALTTVFNDNLQKNALPADASASIQIPEDTNFLIAKPGYTFVGLTTSNGSVTEEPSYNSSRFPSQVVCAKNMSGAARVKNVKIVRNYNYSTGEHDLIMPIGDISDYVVAVNFKTYTPQRAGGYANNKVLDKIKKVTDITWTAAQNVVTNTGNSTFKAGVTYKGIPYRSAWTAACLIGWHITRHTFINAVNDPDSIFYNNPSSRFIGPYYSLVCSSFGTLVAGFPFPMSNWGLVHSPDVYVKKVAQPQLGDLLTNAYGHCLVPIELNTTAEDNYALTIAEQEGPITKINTVLDNIADDWVGIGKISTYVNNYQYACSPKMWDNNAPYSLTAGTIKNGSARPYLGDRCVFTSAMDVKINIKNDEANRLYYQRYTTSTTHGVPGTFTPVADTLGYVEFEVGSTQVIMRSKTTDGSYTGVDLTDGGIYGIWASVDDAQTTPPSNMEYFEWHDVTTNPITFNVQNGVLVTNDQFWYMVTDAVNYTDVYKDGITNGNMTIPYNPPGKTISGTSLSDSDYSKYAEKAYIPSTSSVWAFFRKGQFGAYIVGREVDAGNDDDPDSGT